MQITENEEIVYRVIGLSGKYGITRIGLQTMLNIHTRDFQYMTQSSNGIYYQLSSYEDMDDATENLCRIGLIKEELDDPRFTTAHVYKTMDINSIVRKRLGTK
jgi:hypothetical protein